jgi:hypothetical protein
MPHRLLEQRFCLLGPGYATPPISFRLVRGRSINSAQRSNLYHEILVQTASLSRVFVSFESLLDCQSSFSLARSHNAALLNCISAFFPIPTPPLLKVFGVALAYWLAYHHRLLCLACPSFCLHHSACERAGRSLHYSACGRA